MPEKTKTKTKSFGLQFWLILALCIFVIGGLTFPRTTRGRKKPGDQTEAIFNARQIGLALSEFEAEYGSFPNDETAALVKKKHPSATGLSGKSSNALFRQLFAAGITQSEQMFYAKVSGTKKPDGVITPGNILEKGEVGFGYIAGLSTEGNPARPVAFAPIIPGTRKFDPKPFDGKAVVLRVDNSVSNFQILPNGHVNTSPGQDIFSPGNPIWDGKAPDIRYPE
jgi:hypothetical protein